MGVLLYHSLTYPDEIGSLAGPGSHWVLARLDGQQATMIILPLTQRTGVMGTCSHASYSKVLAIGPQFPMHLYQALLLTRPTPQPSPDFTL